MLEGISGAAAPGPFCAYSTGVVDGLDQALQAFCQHHIAVARQLL